KGLAVLSEVALTEAEQIKLATKRSKKYFHVSHANGSGDGVDTQSKVPDEQQQKTFGTDEGTGTIPGVPDVPPYESESDKESWGDSEDEDNENNSDDLSDNDDDGDSDDHDDDSDDERTESDRDEIPDLKLTNVDQTEHEEEEYDDEFYKEEEDENIDEEQNMDHEEDDEVIKELYDDANVNLGNDDTEMTDADQGASKQQNKADKPVQSSLVSSDFTSKLLNIENPSPANNEISSLLETLTHHATAIPEITSGFTTTTPPPPSVSTLEFELSVFKQTNQFAEAVSSIPGIVDTRKSGKDAESSKDSRSKEKKSSSTSKDASQSQHKSSGKSVHAEEPSHTVEDSGMQQDQEFVTGDNDEQPADKETWISQAALAEEPPTSFDEFNDTSFDFSAFVMNRLKIPNLTQEILVGPAFNLLKGTCKSITELEYHLEECSKATTERLDWHNPENKPYPFDLRKPLPLIQDHRGRQIIPKDYFINKDLEYLKGGDLSRRYSTSVTKTKAATYELKWIKDLVHELWSPVVVKYDQHAYYGTSHWGPKCQSFYGYASNLTSSKDVYSRRRIIAVTRLTIMKKYDYGHLEEIEVRRDDQQLYTFKEGDFKRLRLQDIEDMLLLLVQQKLTNLTIDERYDLNVALRMFTRRIVIQRRVEDLQLGVKSYQKKLNLTKPDTYRSNLRNKTAYTSHSDPHGIIYVDQFKRKRLMRTDELHKFSDGTLNDVRTALHDIAAGIRMEYLPMRKWSNLDKKRARVMVQDIDKQLYQRRLMRNLEMVNRVNTSDYELTDEKKLDDEETIDDQEDDAVIKELYGDVNVNLGNGDIEMTDADQGASKQQNVSQELGFEQEEEDAHLLNLENPSPADNEIASLMETSARHATAIPEITFGFTTTTHPPTPFLNPLLQQQTPTFATTTSTNPTFKQTNQFAEAVSSIPGIVDTYLASKMKEAVDVAVQLQTNKLREEAQAENQEFLNQVDSTMKKIIKDQVKAQVSKIMPKIEKYVTEYLGAEVLVRSTNQPQTSYAVAASLGASHTVKTSGMQQDQEFITRDNNEQPTNRRLAKLTELEYHLEECSKATTERLDWHNPANKPYTFDLRKPLPLIQDHRGRQIIHKDYFINKDLEYLKGGDLSRRYSTSVTKTKAATYELKWIEDLVHELLCLQDIEDMLLLLVQQKLTNLTIDEWYDLNVALHMFTRRIIIQRRVEDLQLGVESYLRMLNSLKPNTYRQNLRNKTTYTSHSDPHGIIYVDQFKRKRLMRTDELHKFSDGTLNDVQTALHDIAAGIRMKYLPMRKWSNLDNKRAWVMVQDIDK
ncbi:hypothetical protein Tco_1408016, partial [Tanacetum coccineum]